MSFFQHQKSIDIASIWSVQIEHCFVQINLGCSRPAIEHQQKEEAKCLLFQHTFQSLLYTIWILTNLAPDFFQIAVVDKGT